MLRVRMMRMLEPVNLALSGAECLLLERVGAAMGAGNSAGEVWQQVKARERKRGGMIDALQSEDLRILDSLFSRLGESGREQQEILLEGARAALDKNLSEAEQKARESERLYLSLGTMVGLILALVVI